MASNDRNPIKCVFPIPPCLSLDSAEDILVVAELAYVWGWALVNVANRAKRMRQFADETPLFVEGWPIGYNAFTLQTEHSSPKERLMCCPNTSLLYGGGAFALGTKGAISQVPKELCENDIFWLYSLYDARTTQFGACGKQHGSEPGFYLIVGPHWDGNNPDAERIPEGHIIHCSTDLAFLTARIFLDPSSHIPENIKECLHKVNFYPAQKYKDGKYQSVDWDSVTNISCPGPTQKKELRYVHPLTFFDELPGILDSVKEQPGEKELYHCVCELLKLAKKDRRVMRICRSVAFETERSTIESYMQWSMNGIAAGNGWYTSVDSGQWKPTEYAYRTATAKSNLFQNRPEDTRYYFTDNDSDKMPLNGKNTYSITFKDGFPPAKGPWSVTVYNQYHFLFAEPYSISNRELPSASVVVHAGPEPPPGDRYFIRTPPNEPFSLYLRAYWMDESSLSTPWNPPEVRKCKVIKAV